MSVLGPPPGLEYKIRIIWPWGGLYVAGANTQLVPTVEFSKAQNGSLAISADRMSDDRLDPLTVDPVTGAESVACDLVGVRRERPGTEGSSAVRLTVLLMWPLTL
jgi:hypothetical protein